MVGLYSGAVVKFSCHPAKRFMVPTPACSFWVGFVCSPCACVSFLWVLKHWEEGRSSNVHRAEVKLSVKQQWKASTAATLCDLFPFTMNSLVALFPPEAHFFGSSSSSLHVASFMIGPSSSQSTESYLMANHLCLCNSQESLLLGEYWSDSSETLSFCDLLRQRCSTLDTCMPAHLCKLHTHNP